LTPNSALTWTFPGADDGIRTRDPHLGNKKRPNSPTWIFANRCRTTGVFD
jgi:hypothetical protein